MIHVEANLDILYYIYMYVYTCMYIKIHMYVYKNTHVQKYIYPRFAAVKQPAPCVVCRDGHPARLAESHPQTPPETRLRWCRKGLSSAKLRMVISIFILCILLCIHVYIYVYCYVCYYCYIYLFI
jgi:hypothetical protein